jgi:hypothetical protein
MGVLQFMLFVRFLRATCQARPHSDHWLLKKVIRHYWQHHQRHGLSQQTNSKAMFPAKGINQSLRRKGA